jgi:hypothetical protein
MYQAKLTRNRIVVATPAQKKKVRVPRIVEKEL